MLRELYLVELTVAELERSIAWYEALGLSVTLNDEATGYVLLESPRGRLGLKEGAPQPGSTLVVFEVDDLTAEIQRLAAADIVPDGPVKASSENYRRALFRDPDGHGVSLFEWTNG